MNDPVGDFVQAYEGMSNRDRWTVDRIIALVALRLMRWVDTVRREKDDPGWWPSEDDVTHSALLQRLLAGRAPLPAAPPNGDYALVERGFGVYRSELVSVYRSGRVAATPDVRGPDRETVLAPGSLVVVGQAGAWVVRGAAEPDGYRVEPVTGEAGPGEWRLVHVRGAVKVWGVAAGGTGAGAAYRDAWALVRSDAERAFASRPHVVEVV